MSNLSPRKQRAVLALVEHGSVSSAADACNVARATLYKWLKEPEFSHELKAASSSRVSEASRRIDGLLLRAIDELERLLSSESEQQRRLAVDSILSHGVRLRELTQLEERVRALEDRARGRY